MDKVGNLFSLRARTAMMAAVSLTSPPVPAATGSASRAARSSPPAIRPRRSAWRDPRLAVGLLLVAGSVLTGASILGDADETTPVLAARQAMLPGAPVGAEDLVTVRVRFAGAEDADRYLPAGAELPADAAVTRHIGAGELLPRGAVGTRAHEATLEVPLPVASERLADGVRAGATVDIWVTPDPGGDTQGELVAESVVVRSADGAASGGGVRQVVVAVPADDQAVVARLATHAQPDRLLVVLRAQ